MRLGRVWLFLAALAAWPADVRADILVAPFLGGTFAGQTTLQVFPVITTGSIPLSKSLVIGAAGLWLSPGILGVEGEWAYAPRFFQRADVQGALTSSSFTTASGSVIVAAPLGLTRESLRPYVAGGLGLLHVGAVDRLNLLAPALDRNLLALNLGGGAIGMLSERTGVRFDLRHTRSVRDDAAPSNVFGQSGSRVRLSYWRATVGVVIAY
jgi:hypothetical protein